MNIFRDTAITPRSTMLSRVVPTCGMGLAMMLVAACDTAPAPPPRPPLEGAAIGGPFSLTDEQNRRVTQADFAGQWTIVYFGYTFCPDVCPVDAAKLMQGLRAFEKQDPARAARVTPLFVSVDPDRDTPEILRAFTDRYHPRLVGLTGTKAEIDAMTRAWAATYARQPTPPGGDPGSYLVAHTQIAYLMDPAGKPVAMLSIDDPATDIDEGAPAKVAGELDAFVRG